MTVPTQWALNQNAYQPSYEMAWVATLNRPMYQPLPLGSGVNIDRIEESNDLQPKIHDESKNEGGATLLQQIPASTVHQGSRWFPMLVSFYSVANPIAIEKFLQHHMQLVGLLFSAFPRIKSTWGSEIRPEMALVDDPEGGFPVLMVRLTSSKPEAYEALDRFDEEWWLDHIQDAEGLLNFSLQER